MTQYISDADEKFELELLQAEFNARAKQLFHKQFPDEPFSNYGTVIGAGVRISKKIGNTSVRVDVWNSQGMTGEYESWKMIKEKIEKLGFSLFYDNGRVD